MRVLILNFILSTAVDGKILRRKSNHDTMIYTMARGFVANGHEVRLLEGDEIGGAKKVLRAAAMTYVAALLMSALQLLRFVLIFLGRSNNGRRGGSR